MFTCVTCKTPKPLDAFYLRSKPRKSDGVVQPFSECKECGKARQRKNRSRPEFLKKEAAFRARRKREYPELVRDQQRQRGLRHRFGISHGDYTNLLKQQDGLCAICRQEETSKLHGVVLPLSVDHCHISGAVRGLLCKRCNTGLGNFNDNPQLIRLALEYLNAYIKR